MNSASKLHSATRARVPFAPPVESKHPGTPSNQEPLASEHPSRVQRQ